MISLSCKRVGDDVLDTFAQRLTQALEIRNITAAELSRRLGLNEGTISNYKKGVYEPKQRRLDSISKALDVSIPWLMGYDVPFASRGSESNTDSIFSSDTVDPYKSRLDDCYNRLNDSGKKEACRRISELTEIPRYIAPQDEEQTSKLAIVAMGGDGVKFIKTTKEADEEVKRILDEMWEEENR